METLNELKQTCGTLSQLSGDLESETLRAGDLVIRLEDLMQDRLGFDMNKRPAESDPESIEKGLRDNGVISQMFRVRGRLLEINELLLNMKNSLEEIL